MAASPGVDRLLAAARLVAVAFDPSLPLILIGGAGAADSTVLPGRHARSGPQAVLAALYPHDHLVRALPDGPSLAIEDLTDAELEAGDWLVPPLAPLDNLASPHGMAAISARLRATDGCQKIRQAIIVTNLVVNRRHRIVLGLCR